MHEPEALAHAIGIGKRATASPSPTRDDLEPEHAVEAVGLGDDLAADVGHADRTFLPADDHLLPGRGRRTALDVARRGAPARRAG